MSTPRGTYQMPRSRYPHLPLKDRLYEGVRAPQSKKTLLTVDQINRFYDSAKSDGNTRNRLWRAGVEPVAFGPIRGRGQRPMLFKAGEAQRALEMLDAADQYLYTATTNPTSTPTEVHVHAEPLPAAETMASVASELAAVAEMEPEIVAEASEADEANEVADTVDSSGLLRSTEITFNAIVDDESCDELMQKVHEALENGAKEITIWISSEGGSLFAALGTYDRLRYLQRTHDVNIYTVATGYVLSAGMLLLAAGQVRYALPHALFMLHEPYQMPWETGEDAKVLVTEIHERGELHQLSIEKIAHIFFERDHRPEADYESWLDFFKVPAKKYFGAEEALDWGLVEEKL